MDRGTGDATTDWILEGPPGRIVRAGGAEYLYFGGNDYLGMSGHPETIAAAKEAVDRFGVGAAASRRTTGTIGVHRELERALAHWKGEEDACLFASGYLGPRAVIEAAARPGDLFAVDESAHPALQTALPRQADVMTFPHFDGDGLRVLLASRSPDPRVLVLFDAIDAEGRTAPLEALADAVAERPHLLIADGAHGFGILGKEGRGLAGTTARRDLALIETATLSKALGSFGGFVAAEGSVIAGIRAAAPSYGGATALPAASAAAALAALCVLAREPERRRRVFEVATTLAKGLAHLGAAVHGGESPFFSPPNWTGARAERIAECARSEGILIPKIRYPTAASAARLRLVVTSEHRDEDIRRLLELISRVL